MNTAPISQDEKKFKSAVNKCDVIWKKWSEQAISPSKNYINLEFNAKGCVWRIWFINASTARHPEAAGNSASEEVCTHQDFIDGQWENDIRRYLGQTIYDEAMALVKGKLAEGSWTTSQPPV
eukprot:m.24275 g.24275  ORF g.24275 m.24275 type:complete len:122 (-) comp14521_c0_seq1:116-481(-)